MQILSPGIRQFNDHHVWFLTTKETSYVIGVDQDSQTLLNLYWGRRLVSFQDIELPIKLSDERSSQDPSITSAPEEFPAFGGLRYGPDVLRVEFDNGTRELDLIYHANKFSSQALVITLVDRVHTSLQVDLHYSIDIDHDLILKRTCLKSYDGSLFKVTKSLTAAFHVPPVPDHSHRELITLAGAWSCETQVQKHSLKPGTSHVLESTRGIPSAQAYPYFAIKDQSSDGEHNDCEVYFGTIGWSGNWKIEVHTDIDGQVRIVGGMNDRDFKFDLKQSMELPVFVGGYTTHGLFGARRSLTSYIRDNKTVKGPEALAPVLYNGWEAYAFDVNIENQKVMAEKAAALGTELFVLDDGWFHKRNSDNAGLGDWYADKSKFPDGLKPLADHVHHLGMKFGLWFEPEMVNPDSNLYREHPDWVYHYPDRPRHLERNQLVLNIGKPEVYKYLLDRIVSLVREVGIDFIKWDMNRPISEAGSEFNEDVWRIHVETFHKLIRKIKQETNGIQIETCCSGGGRADLSILRRVESCWPSDNTRPDARLLIQYGASFIMPTNSMSCWVTDMPNDDPYLKFPISYRFHVSFMGTLGIGSDLNKLTAAEWEEYRHWILLYKQFRHVLQRGCLDWLVTPSNDVGSYTAVTQTTSESGDEAVVLAFRQSSPFWLPLHALKLRGLTAFAVYSVTIWSTDPRKPVFTGTMSGSALVNKGIELPYMKSKSYSSVVIHVKQKSTIN